MEQLNLNSLYVNYGQIKALFDVSIKVSQSEVVSVLGANGAGKTTLLNTIMGITRAAEGSILFNGKTINSLPPHLICGMGIGFVPEGRRVFAELTVMENLEIGSYKNNSKINRAEQLQYVLSLFPILKERKKQFAGTLSGGEQQMLAIGRALMLNPALLLLDEPSMGLAPLIIKEIFLALKEINKRGTSILLVEQSAYLALRISDRAYIMESGSILVEDNVENMRSNSAMKKSYLGI